jgi:hypothetical protein
MKVLCKMMSFVNKLYIVIFLFVGFVMFGKSCLDDSREYIPIVENNISIDRKALKELIIDEWQSGRLYKNFYDKGRREEALYRDILFHLADSMDAFLDEIIKHNRKTKKKTVSLVISDTYPKTDSRSIAFETLNKLWRASMIEPEELVVDDIPAILEFLDTPPGKELEAWDKWEKYWASLDYPARRKKLLGDEGKK